MVGSGAWDTVRLEGFPWNGYPAVGLRAWLATAVVVLILVGLIIGVWLRLRYSRVPELSPCCHSASSTFPKLSPDSPTGTIDRRRTVCGCTRGLPDRGDMTSRRIGSERYRTRGSEQVADPRRASDDDRRGRVLLPILNASLTVAILIVAVCVLSAGEARQTSIGRAWFHRGSVRPPP